MAVKKGMKRVWLDPTAQRVITYEEFKETCQSNFQAGLEKGFQQGYSEGKRKSKELAFEDMAALWEEVSKAHMTASSYAKTLADIHRVQVPKAAEEKK